MIAPSNIIYKTSSQLIYYLFKIYYILIIWILITLNARWLHSFYLNKTLFLLKALFRIIWAFLATFAIKYLRYTIRTKQFNKLHKQYQAWNIKENVWIWRTKIISQNLIKIVIWTNHSLRLLMMVCKSIKQLSAINYTWYS